MAEDRIQLKQEEIVGNDIVLNDINPKSNTRSIDDVSSGMPLDKTIERLWQSINNKLSRIVNSVNGRTGVVVLDANDVGLGNVDNVSLADIKKWVINRMEQEFGHKRLILFEYLDDMESYIADNDETHKNKPFYSHHGFKGDDDRAYIGYTWWDEGTRTLKETHMVIDTVGRTDNSIIYNENINDRDLTGGGIGVNIWKYEEALELYNDISGAKADSGLRINTDSIIGKVYYFDGLYGNGETDDTDAMLYMSNVPGAPTVIFNIYKNSKHEVLVIGGKYLRRTDLKYGDIIITNFSDELYHDENGDLLPGIDKYLTCRQPCIGFVTSAPNKFDKANTDPMHWVYKIDFYQLHANLGWGLSYTQNHTDNVTNTLNRDKEISIQLVKGIRENGTKTSDISGLNMFRKVPKTTNKKFVTMLPEGPVEVLSGTSGSDNGNGLMITPNYSLCVIPVDDYSGSNSFALNWDASIPSTGDTSMSDVDNSYMSNTSSLLGVNLIKSIVHFNTGEEITSGFVNLSGLRINDTSALSETWGGSNSSIEEYLRMNHSGGLSVNVGKFLEISAGDIQTTSENFYDGGKVNVSIDTTRGLIDNGSNQLSINIDTDSGLSFTDEGAISMKIGRGLWKPVRTDDNGETINDGSIVEVKINEDGSNGLLFDEDGYIKLNLTNTKPDEDGDFVISPESEVPNTLQIRSKTNLDIVDGSKNTIRYTPIVGETYNPTTMTIELGPGLIIEP